MKITRILSVIVCTIALTLNAPAGTPEETAAKAIVTVNLKDMPVGDAIKVVGKLAEVKAHYDAKQEVVPMVTLSLKDVTASEAFEYIALAAGLSVSYKDDGVHFNAKQASGS